LFLAGCGDEPILGEWQSLTSTRDVEEYFIIQVDQQGVYRAKVFVRGAHIATREFALRWKSRREEHSYSVDVDFPDSSKNFDCFLDDEGLNTMECHDDFGNNFWFTRIEEGDEDT
jgi:hypothetical protein